MENSSNEKLDLPWESIGKKNPLAWVLVDSKGCLVFANSKAKKLAPIFKKEKAPVFYPFSPNTFYLLEIFNGKRFVPYRVIAKSLPKKSKAAFVLYLEEQSEKIKLQEQILRFQKQQRQLAYHDPLTQLPNRQLFFDRFSQALEQAKRNDFMVAVLFLDLDGFKSINDAQGHAFGDEVLEIVARKLKQALRASDTVARIGGDEFSIILANLIGTRDAIYVAQKILKLLATPLTLNNENIQLTASIGISFYPLDGQLVEPLLKFADLAMYRAKEKGKNRFEIYNQSINTTAYQNVNLGFELARAIKTHQLEVHYQKIWDRKNKVVAYEALSRWHHPELGNIEPKRFFEIAQQNQLEQTLHDWIVEQIVLESRQQSTDSSNASSPKTFINLTAKQFRNSEFLDQFVRICRKHDVLMSQFGFEISEATLMENLSYSEKTLFALKRLGFTIILDGFGRGFASLHFINRLPIHWIKIDRKVIQGIPKLKESTQFSEAMITMLQKMGKKVIALGVEKSTQHQKLIQMKCDGYQGFFFDKPKAIAKA